MIAKIFSKLAGRFPRLRSREFYAETFDFQSGLGDSAWLLYGLARSIKPKVCVEIGSARGKSACAVGLALRRNGGGKLYAIDPHRPTNWNDTASVDSFSIITENLRKAGVTEFVEIVRKISGEAAKGWTQKIDLIFIDGDHSYEGVKADWALFLPYLNEFGVVVFHDTLWDLRPDPKIARADMGVPRFVDELRAAGYPVITIDQNYGVSLVQPKIGGVKLR
jgi:predicted O-methyltransferase YrrM